MPDHHRLACTLSAAAKAMPAGMRRSFRWVDDELVPTYPEEEL